MSQQSLFLWIAAVVLRSWIIGSSKFYHSFFFAFAKTHSYRTSTQDVLGTFLAHDALAKIRSLAMTKCDASLRASERREAIQSTGGAGVSCPTPHL